MECGVRSVIGSRPSAAPPGRGTRWRITPSPVVVSACTGPHSPSTNGNGSSCIPFSMKTYHESVTTKSCGASGVGKLALVTERTSPAACPNSKILRSSPSSVARDAHAQPTNVPRRMSGRGWAVKASPVPRSRSTRSTPVVTAAKPPAIAPPKVSYPSKSRVRGSTRTGRPASHSAYARPPQACTLVLATFFTAILPTFATRPAG
mmetsp:Transcript_34881/g.112457  ORF Transcript_34881/g.112457 Transcript_34881/m.112457 type:complete len:205 (+) Transcript_34881:624-1238(+)|eukprot:scaffold21044_cov124-Isochrysis_galbana.AAC.4